MSNQNVVVPLAPGFEEIEAVCIIDVLRRAEVEVVIAGLEAGPVTGSHGITLVPDVSITAVEASETAMVVLPGGLPGAINLRDDPSLQRLLKAVHDQGGYACAICAAPMALMPEGVGADHTLTSYPGFETHLSDAAAYREERVVVDRRVVTSRGPGTALEFALTLVSILVSQEKADELERAMLVDRSQLAWSAG